MGSRVAKVVELSLIHIKILKIICHCEEGGTTDEAIPWNKHLLDQGDCFVAALLAMTLLVKKYPDASTPWRHRGLKDFKTVPPEELTLRQLSLHLTKGQIK